MRKSFLVVAGMMTAVVISVLWLRRDGRPVRSTTFSDSAQPVAQAQQQQSAVLPSSPAGMAPITTTTPKTTPGFGELRQLLAAILKESDPGLRSDLLRQLLESAPAESMPALLDSLNGLAGMDDVRAELLRAWTTQDPKAATAWAVGLTSPDAQIAAIKSIATAQADADLPKALEWLESLPGDALRDQAAAAISYEAARSDPKAALKIATELPPGSDRDDLAIRAVREWAATNPQAAAEWSLGITDETLRQQAIAAAASVWGTIDPAAAAAFATKNLPSNETLSNVAVDILQNWATTAPQDAAAWVALFPEGDLRNTALNSVISKWAETSPAAVAAWIAEQPAGNLKDRGLYEYANAIAETDPVAAIPIVQGISDESLRSEQTETVVGKWQAKDPTAARTWIETSKLDPETKKRLLGLSPGGQPNP